MALQGKVALVAGATRGAGRGIAVELGAVGATVYCTGRTTRTTRSEMNRPETIEETAALVDAAGGHGIAVRVDHLVPDEVRALVDRIEREQGALHILVNDIFGATRIEWNKSVWESRIRSGYIRKQHRQSLCGGWMRVESIAQCGERELAEHSRLFDAGRLESKPIRVGRPAGGDQHVSAVDELCRLRRYYLEPDVIPGATFDAPRFGPQ
jgi:NAD(P)-dependent dehydrogenase (short-subunit alcohol dehydrogenase family)